MKSGMCLPAARSTSEARTCVQTSGRRAPEPGNPAPISYPSGGRCQTRMSLPSVPRHRKKSRSCPGSRPRPRHSTPTFIPNSRPSVGNAAGWPKASGEYTTSNRPPRRSASAAPSRRFRTSDSPEGISSSASTYQIGPWYVLADELIPSGESLVRNLLLGAADAERLGGRLDVMYSPDAFGHPAALPTLGREFGMKVGLLWRGLGREPGQERDFVRWRGTDGKDILVWHLPPDGYEIGAALPGSGARLPDVWTQVRASLVERAAGKHIPLFIGADHHAPHPTLARLRDLLADLEPASAFRIFRLDEFFQAAEASPARAIAGELRSSYGYAWTLQGVHGTRAPLKRRHAQVELWLERLAEPLVALARN